MKGYIIVGGDIMNSDIPNIFETYEDAVAQIEEWNEIDSWGGFESTEYKIIEEV